MDPEEKAHIYSIVALYNIEGSVDITRVNGLHTSRVYRLYDNASGNNFAMRIPVDFDHRIVANEAQISEQLAQSGLVAPSLLPNKDHALWFNEHICWSGTVATWLDGEHPTPSIIDNEMCELLGRSLATFHMRVKVLPYNIDNKLMPDDVEQWLVEHDNVSWDVGLLKRLWELKNASLPRGIVHGDFHTNNLLISTSGVGILDMERSGEGLLIIDIARAAIDICRAGGTIDLNRLRHFIDGYEQVRQLSEQERKYLITAMHYAMLVVSEWFKNRGYQETVKDLVLAGSSLQKREWSFSLSK